MATEIQIKQAESFTKFLLQKKEFLALCKKDKKQFSERAFAEWRIEKVKADFLKHSDKKQYGRIVQKYVC